MPPRHAFRLEDLRVFHLVRASCHACGHKAIVPNAALLQERPGYTRLISLERQLRCRKCGARGKASLEVDFGRGTEEQRRGRCDKCRVFAGPGKGRNMVRRTTLRERIETRIARKRGEDVFLPREFADLGGEDQVLRGLMREGRLVRLGYGVYARRGRDGALGSIARTRNDLSER